VIGDVTATSPGPTPTANAAPCSAAVPDENDVRGERFFEAPDRRPLRDEVAAQRLRHRGHVGVVDLLAPVGEERRRRVGHAAALTSADISLTSSTDSQRSFVSEA
jgi:hypothetical protein